MDYDKKTVEFWLQNSDLKFDKSPEGFNSTKELVLALSLSSWIIYRKFMLLLTEFSKIHDTLAIEPYFR